MQPTLIVQLLVLLTLANGTPVTAKKFLGSAFARPLDGGALFLDGRPLFGPSKTIRGIVLSILATSSCAPAIGLEWKVGALIGIMAGRRHLLQLFETQNGPAPEQYGSRPR